MAAINGVINNFELLREIYQYLDIDSALAFAEVHPNVKEFFINNANFCAESFEFSTALQHFFALHKNEFKRLRIGCNFIQLRSRYFPKFPNVLSLRLSNVAISECDIWNIVTRLPSLTRLKVDSNVNYIREYCDLNNDIPENGFAITDMQVRFGRGAIIRLIYASSKLESLIVTNVRGRAIESIRHPKIQSTKLQEHIHSIVFPSSRKRKLSPLQQSSSSSLSLMSLSSQPFLYDCDGMHINDANYTIKIKFNPKPRISISVDTVKIQFHIQSIIQGGDLICKYFQQFYSEEFNVKKIKFEGDIGTCICSNTITGDNCIAFHDICHQFSEAQAMCISKFRNSEIKYNFLNLNTFIKLTSVRFYDCNIDLDDLLLAFDDNRTVKLLKFENSTLSIKYSSKCVSEIEVFPNITELVLGYDDVTFAHIFKLYPNCFSNLSVLHLKKYSRIVMLYDIKDCSETILLTLPKLKNLKHLKLSNCNLNPISIMTISELCMRNLSCIYIDALTSFNTASFRRCADSLGYNIPKIYRTGDGF